MKQLSWMITVLILGGCSAIPRLEHVGSPPPLTPIKDPTKLPNYHPVTMPMPEPKPVSENPHGQALWREGSRDFFQDNRAKAVGDPVTVLIDLNSSVTLDDNTKFSRTDAASAGVTNALGFEQYIRKVLPHAGSAANLLNYAAQPSQDSTGKLERTDEVQFTISATIVQMLPNESAVIMGRSEYNLDGQLNFVSIQGIIRFSDITSANTIDIENVAEARVDYGGVGQLSDVRTPSYGEQFARALSPF
jgi:flagellar L-ring protein precursor FlgH